MTPYQLGKAAALHHLKLSAERVLVTNGQTYQYTPDPAFISDPMLRDASVESTWDAHDRRFETDIKAHGDNMSATTSADG
jgi:hypothetical protein